MGRWMNQNVMKQVYKRYDCIYQGTWISQGNLDSLSGRIFHDSAGITYQHLIESKEHGAWNALK